MLLRAETLLRVLAPLRFATHSPVTRSAKRGCSSVLNECVRTNSAEPYGDTPRCKGYRAALRRARTCRCACSLLPTHQECLVGRITELPPPTRARLVLLNKSRQTSKAPHDPAPSSHLRLTQTLTWPGVHSVQRRTGRRLCAVSSLVRRAEDGGGPRSARFIALIILPRPPSNHHTNSPWEVDHHFNRFHGLTVMTADSDSASEGSTPSGTFLFAHLVNRRDGPNSVSRCVFFLAR